MNYIELHQLADAWNQITHNVLDLQSISSLYLQDLLKETYRALLDFHKASLVPKEISRLLLEMDSFLYFASMIEEKENKMDFYHYKKIHAVVTAFKKGFFSGDYGCEFPFLKIKDEDNSVKEINLESDLFKRELPETDALIYKWFGLREDFWSCKVIEVDYVQSLFRETSKILRKHSSSEFIPKSISGLIEVLKDFEADVTFYEEHPLHGLYKEITDIIVFMTEAFHTCDFENSDVEEYIDKLS